VSSTKRNEITEKDVVGLKYFSRLRPLLTRLHQCGCVRDKAGNRTLHFDQYGSLVLLFLFNPIVQSLRSIQQASELKKVQKKLGCARVAGIVVGVGSRLRSEPFARHHRRVGSATATAANGPEAQGRAANRNAGRRYAVESVAADYRSGSSRNPNESPVRRGLSLLGFEPR